MSSQSRKIITYPNQKIYNEVKKVAEKQGTSTSKVVQTALREFLNKDKHRY